jgi:hypothetical protein
VCVSVCMSVCSCHCVQSSLLLINAADIDLTSIHFNS